MEAREIRAAAQFEQMVERHEMTILLDEGLYRHVRFRRPDELGYWFDLVTWPGYLAINGDLISGYTFARIEDMFNFFAGDHINPMYWAEKITCPKTETRVYDPDRFDPATMDEPPWEWDWSFLYSCHAIQWGVGRYREEKGDD
jgi:hypothetical protein